MPHHPSARFFIPSPTLGACVFAGIERDTRGLSLTDTERFNYYPATPLATLSWIFEGTLHLVEERAPSATPTLGPALPRLLFSGPQRLPSASWSPGPVHAMSIAFYPEVLERLLGISVKPFFDQTVSLETVASKEVMKSCETLFAVPRDTELFRCFEEQFMRLWQGPSLSSSAPILGDWIRSLATRAVHSTAGKGIRQFQRHIKHWTGQSHRNLQLFTRVEEAFLRRIEHRRGAALDLAALAHEAGFSDQSHMGREIRRITGLSPAHFDELVAHDEAFWFYRLLEGQLGGH